MSVLYNHNIRPDPSYGECKYHEIKETPGFAARSLLLPGPDDYLQLDERLQPHVEFAREHWDQMGVKLPDDEHMIWETSPGIAADHPANEASIYLIDEEWADVLKRRNPDEAGLVDAWLSAVKRLDDKNEFVKWCIGNGFVVPATPLIVESGETPDLSKIIDYPVIGKTALGLFGSGVEKYYSEAELRAGLPQLGSRYQIQEAIDALDTVSSQYHASHGRATLMAETGAHVSQDFAHQGTFCPTSYKPHEVTEPVAKAAAAIGLQGPFNVDGVVDKKGRVYNIELNPRPTWGYYAIMAVQKLATAKGEPIKSWSAFNMGTKLKLTHPNARQLQTLAYQGDRGIALLSTALMDKRVKPYCEVIFIGTPAEQTELKQDVAKILWPKRRPRLQKAA
jgi:hypothetical protein